MKYCIFLFLFLRMGTSCAWGQISSSVVRNDVKTTFQTSSHWKPITDIRADAVMVYGANNYPNETFEDRLNSWKRKGYVTHFMTGIAWGEYQDYFLGKWDGKQHFDEGQKTVIGDTIWHGHYIPYIVPTMNYLAYFKQCHIKPVIDAGIDHIFLEEPEFWARAGYSEAFKREWQNYYNSPWKPQHTSAENIYLSNKLKYYLYYRALDETFSYAKKYGNQKGIDVKCFVPTHSLLNYSQWMIVSPEASLASLKSVDGYIAQVWTGTSREPNYFEGEKKERVFPTAFLEYGCMLSMTKPTHRKIFFLTDPIEDWPRDWADYRHNYQATFTAQLLYPENNNYEVMPWPDRIYEGLYNVSANSKEKAHIPSYYATQMQVMVNALNDMPISSNKVSGSHGIAVLMANSLMFQRSAQPIEGYDDPQLSNFYGESLPLLLRGIPVELMHLENVSFPDCWKGVKVLLMSYSNMKPMDSKAHEYIAEWVKKGGVLVYCGRDDDPFQKVTEWWNQGNMHFNAPSQHLFHLMDIPMDALEGSYSVGNGKVYVIRQDPKEFVLSRSADSILIKTVRNAYENDAKAGQLILKNSFYLERGAYNLLSVLPDSIINTKPYIMKGMLIDMFDPRLPILEKKVVTPGHEAFVLDINRLKKKDPQVLAAAARVYNETIRSDSYSFMMKGPEKTENIARVLLPHEPSKVEVVGANGHIVEFSSDWHEKSHTLLLSFTNSSYGNLVRIFW